VTASVVPATAQFVAQAAPKLSASSPTGAAVAGALAYAAVRASEH
jgi:hypothetical protein